MSGRLYTRTGDSGTTLCFALGEGGKPARVSKSHPLIEFLGALDEANTFVGLARVYAVEEGLSDVAEDLEWMQRFLFNVGFSLAGQPKVSEYDVKRLEEVADKYYGEPLKRFVIPGGTKASAHLHVARSVVRRAERRLVAVMEQGVKVDPVILKALNRASDALFAMAVYAARKANALEEL